MYLIRNWKKAMKLSRRVFLKLAGASAATGALSLNMPAIASLTKVETKYEHLANKFLNIRNLNSVFAQEKYTNYSAEYKKTMLRNSVDSFFLTMHDKDFKSTSVEDTLFVFSLAILMFRYDHYSCNNYNCIWGGVAHLASLEKFQEEFGSLILRDGGGLNVVEVHVDKLMYTDGGERHSTYPQILDVLKGYIPESPGKRNIV